jgi:amino acid adenylation domain-containing protein
MAQPPVIAAAPRVTAASGIEAVVEVVADVLDLAEDGIDPAAQLLNLGLESFTAVRLRRRLRERTGVELPFTEFFGPASCVTLAAALDAGPGGGGPDGGGPDGGGPAPSAAGAQAGRRPGPAPTRGPEDPDGDPGGRIEARLPAERWAALREQAAARHLGVADAVHAAATLVLVRWLGRPAAAHTVLREPGGRTELGPSAPAAPDLIAWKGFAHYAGEIHHAVEASAPESPMRQVVRVDADGALVAWEPVGPDGGIDGRDAFPAYLTLLTRLGDPEAWTDASLGWDPTFARPEPPAASPYPGAGPLLHDPARRAARTDPAAPALLGAADRDDLAALSHGDLAALVQRNAGVLRGFDVGPGDLVAVACPKGPAQIAAVLSVAATGAGFVPVEARWPAARVDAVCAAAGVRHAIAARDLSVPLPDRIRTHAIDPSGRLPAADGPAYGVDADPPGGRPARPDDLAYVIFTSGSTGTPKGVAVEHRAARTTVDDITDRFAVGPADRVLALSALSFDLSIYDIFGVLGAGGALVLPDEPRRHDPAHWLALMGTHGVTVWNTAPALMEMLVEEAEGRPAEARRALSALRLVLLSGDWIPVTLPDRLRAIAPHARFISLGGATEAAIWSICYPVTEVDPAWASIPYGRALRGQEFHVLDPAGRPCPVGEAGELYIGGAGLARGYLGDPGQTAERFVVSEVLGERLYRTGDLGRWRPDGTIEFLGRVDRQVKIRGHRIELGEIESVLNRLPTVRQCVVVTLAATNGSRRLAAYVVPSRAAEPPSRATLLAELRDHLPEYMMPQVVVLLDRLPVTPNGKIDYRALPDPNRAVAHG